MLLRSRVTGGYPMQLAVDLEDSFSLCVLDLYFPVRLFLGSNNTLPSISKVHTLIAGGLDILFFEIPYYRPRLRHGAEVFLLSAWSLREKTRGDMWRDRSEGKGATGL